MVKLQRNRVLKANAESNSGKKKSASQAERTSSKKANPQTLLQVLTQNYDPQKEKQETQYELVQSSRSKSLKGTNPSMGSLVTSTSASDRMKKIQAQSQLILDELPRLQESIAELKRANKELKNANQELTSQNRELKRTAQGDNSKQNTQSEQLLELLNENSIMLKKLESLQKANLEQQQQIRQYKKQQEKLTEKISDLREQRHTLQAKLKTTEQSHKDMLRDLSTYQELQTQYNLLFQAHQELIVDHESRKTDEQELQNIIGAYDTLKAQFDERNQFIENLSTQHQSLQESIQFLQTSQEAKNQSYQDLENQFNTMRNLLMVMQSERDSLLLSNEKLSQKVRDLKQELESSVYTIPDPKFVDLLLQPPTETPDPE